MGIFDAINHTLKKSKILNELNDAQKKPVKDYKGASVIIAGPGAGKTRVLVSRTAYMIEDGIDPRSILLFTFTRKAANEIKERIQKYIGDKASTVTVGTYHSFCLRILKNYHLLIGYDKNFTVFDEADSIREFKKICPKDIDPKIIAAEISRFKDNMISPLMAVEQADNDYKRKIALVYNEYGKALKNQNALDFDDITYYAVRILQNFPEIRELMNEKYQYIISDESQDASIQNLELIELLGGKSFNVCLIADDDQSIYSFRGSNVNAMFNFVKSHNMKQFLLGQNYRSTQTIVDAARNMIRRNDTLFEKTIFSKGEVGDKISVCAVGNPTFEADQVVSQIQQAVNNGMKLSDIAVLYRMNYLSRKIEDAFLKNGIPYQISNGITFYGRREIKDLMCYLRFIYNDTDRAAFERIINVPKRGIGEVGIKKILETNSSSLTESCKTVKLNSKPKALLNHFVAVIEVCREMLNTHPPKEILREIVRQIKYYDYIRRECPEDADERIGNIKELLEIAEDYLSVSEFLENVTISDDEADTKSKGDKVSLMTMHGSKGLEFPMVIIVGATDGIIPSARSVAEGNLQEERRLMYVSITRAKTKLFITYPKITFCNGVPMNSRPSRFLAEIGKEYIEKI